MKNFIQQFIVLLYGLFSVVTVSATEVLVLHTDFVSNIKFDKLKPIAQQASVQLKHINIDQHQDDLKPLITQADVVVLDVPRPSDREAVEARSLAILKESKQAYMTVGGGAPEFQDIPKLFGFRLLGLYANGGELNFKHYFQSIATWKNTGKKLSYDIQKLPDIAVYHPRAGQYFHDVSAYKNWFLKAQLSAPKAKIAYLMSQSMITNLTTEKIDQLIALTEQQGVMPVVVLWRESKANTRLAEFLKAQGISALVNLTHIQQGKKIVEDLEQLNIPMLQGMHSRQEGKDWQKAASGVAPQMTAMFIALPETWGISDPLVLSVQEGNEEKWLVPQVKLLLDKVIAQAQLQNLANSDKKLAVMFWNYPNGQNNLSSANMNIPLSLQNIQQALQKEGYSTKNLDEKQWIEASQQLLAPFYQPEKLAHLEQKQWLAYYPVKDYQDWVENLPQHRQEQLQAQAQTEQLKQHWAVVERDGKLYFAIPKASFGNFTLLPQPPRASQLGENYHSLTSIPDPLYLATYLYLQQSQHALIHLGTHGTQEWLPGKDRGLDASDYPYLTAGGLPIFYPYIQDNIAEAIQAKRRGRAVTISHQTAPLAPSGLYDELRDLHDLIHQYIQLDEGTVKQQVAEDLISSVEKSGMLKDLHLSTQEIKKDFTVFFNRLHDHLHALAQQAVPMGLHTFGQSASDEQRLIMVMQQLGEDYFKALNTDYAEAFNGDQAFIQQSLAFRFLAHHVLKKEDAEVNKISLKKSLEAFITQAKLNYDNLSAEQELKSLINALNGGFVLPGNGGDPIRQPQAVSGRNLYAFEASKIPSATAYEIGAKTFQQMIEQYQLQHPQQYPKKLAFSLWSSETIRHLGVTEAQILHALGLQPVWNQAGDLVRLDIIPQEKLQRPRVDVVIQVTSVYRDQFDQFMRMVADAIERLSVLDDAQNPIFSHAQAMQQALIEKNMGPQQAKTLSQLKFFSNQPGEYGSGLIQKALAYDDWESDEAVANTFLNNLQYAYGKNHWGEQLDVNLFAENLKGVDMAVMSRSSNIHGVLSTDHAFEYLGGLSMAIRQVQGHSPELLITDLRQNKSQISTLKSYLSDELRTRYLNPEWIKNIQEEGYAGTLEVLTVTNNLYGWNVTDPQVVRDDQWQDLYDTYVHDKRQLGINEWFKTHNPSAQLQVLNRMAEAIRQDYWQADETTRQEISAKIQSLQQSLDLPEESKRLSEFISSIQSRAEDQQLTTASPTEQVTPEQDQSIKHDDAPQNTLKQIASKQAQVSEVPVQQDQAPSKQLAKADRHQQQNAQGQGLNPMTSSVTPLALTTPRAQNVSEAEQSNSQSESQTTTVKGQTLTQVKPQAQPDNTLWFVGGFISLFIAIGFSLQLLQQRQS
ncbi:cobaltochelatase subunit CobN [Acinetobacter baumannii]|uniref:cobaltochelatase subunit CobN n=1 Tax=Acinetobacter baumannii TaxID=470 RepID=UPI003A8B932F